jgi:hypothetical protein
LPERPGGGGGWGGWGGGGWHGGDNHWTNHWTNNWTVNNNNYYFGPWWSGAHHGGWHHGCWGHQFWHGFSSGIVSLWGFNALTRPQYVYSSWGYVPPAWNIPVYGSWGLASVASDWIFADYANPYVTNTTQTVVVNVPASGASRDTTEQAVFDYSRPIDTTASPPEPSTTSAHAIFESAREQFKSGQYGRALMMADYALAELPNDPALHEFRALTLFAVERYEEAAAVIYAALSAGPGWDWATLSGLYDDLEEYTRQLRALERAAVEQPDSAAVQFLLGYHYLVQGHDEAAAEQFAKAAELRPNDALSSRFARALSRKTATTSGPPSPATAATMPGADSAVAADVEAPPPPDYLMGTWIAKPADGTIITLSLRDGGDFVWAVSSAGRTETIEGQASFDKDVLVLGQEEGPPLAGRIAMQESNTRFVFTPPSAADSASGLAFVRH